MVLSELCLQVCESRVLQSPAFYVVYSDGPDCPLRGAADAGSGPTGQVKLVLKLIRLLHESGDI